MPEKVPRGNDLVSHSVFQLSSSSYFSTFLGTKAVCYYGREYKIVSYMSRHAVIQECAIKKSLVFQVSQM